MFVYVKMLITVWVSYMFVSVGDMGGEKESYANMICDSVLECKSILLLLTGAGVRPTMPEHFCLFVCLVE